MMFIHIIELGRGGKSDSEQLAHAIKHKRAILTHNIKDFINLSKSYDTQGKHHRGIIASTQLSFNELLRRALRFLSSETSNSIKNRFIWLNNYK